MSSVFTSADLQRILKGKHVLFLGDSIVRALYKDIVWLYNCNYFLPVEALKQTNTESFPDLEEIRCRNPLVEDLKKIFPRVKRDTRTDYYAHIPGREYKETREYKTGHGGANDGDHGKITFRFLTRIWSSPLLNFLVEYEEKNNSPLDFIFINSALWDVTRWGPNSPKDYQQNISHLLHHLSQVCPTAQVIYLTSPPVSLEINSKGMAVPGLESNMLTACHQVLHANKVAAVMFTEAGHSVLDFYYYLQFQSSRRDPDGVHWDPLVTRFLVIKITTRIESLYESTVEEKLIDMQRIESVELRLKTLYKECLKKARAAPITGSLYIQTDNSQPIPGSLSELEKEYVIPLMNIYHENRFNPSVPCVDFVTSWASPRIYRQKEHPYEVIGRDTIEEFLDTNHPLWWEQRAAVNDIWLIGQRTKNNRIINIKLAKYISLKWNDSENDQVAIVSDTIENFSIMRPPIIEENNNKNGKRGYKYDGENNRQAKQMKLSTRDAQKENITNENNTENLNEKINSEITFEEARRMYIILSGLYNEDEDFSKVLEDFSNALEFRKAYRPDSEHIKVANILQLASVEKSLGEIKIVYKSPYNGVGVINSGKDVTDEEASFDIQVAKLKESLSKKEISFDVFEEERSKLRSHLKLSNGDINIGFRGQT